MKVLLITTSNTISVEEINTEPKWEAFAKLIGCSWIEVVRPAGMQSPFCMVVDEEGLLCDEPKINHVGSFIYGTHIHGSPIVGNIVIAAEGFVDGDVDLIGLDDKTISYLYQMLKNQFNLKEKESAQRE